MRSNFTRPFLAAAALAVSVAALYGFLVFLLPAQRVAAFGFFGVAGVCSLVCGRLLGGPLWHSVSEGGLYLAALIVSTCSCRARS